MSSNTTILTCTAIKYYSQKDEDTFLKWIKKIENIDAAGRELYLHIATNDLHEYVYENY